MPRGELLKCERPKEGALRWISKLALESYRFAPDNKTTASASPARFVASATGDSYTRTVRASPNTATEVRHEPR